MRTRSSHEATGYLAPTPTPSRRSARLISNRVVRAAVEQPAAGALHPRAYRQHHKQVKKRTGVLRQSAQAWWWRFRPADGRPMRASESDSWTSPLPSSGQSSTRRRRRFPSTFAPPDAWPRGTGWNKQGRLGTAETVDRLFVHVTGYGREQVGMGRDPRGGGGATCKIAGIAYTGSNPIPATLPLSCGNAAADRTSGRVRRSGFPPPDAPPRSLACSAPLGRRCV